MLLYLELDVQILMNDVLSSSMDGILNGKAYKDEISIFGSNLGTFLYFLIHHLSIQGAASISFLQPTCLLRHMPRLPHSTVCKILKMYSCIQC